MIIDIDWLSTKPEIIHIIKTKKKKWKLQIIVIKNNQEIQDLSTTDKSINKVINKKLEKCLNIPIHIIW